MSVFPLSLQNVFGDPQIKWSIDIARPLFRDDPRAAVGSLERIPFHQHRAAREVDRTLAQIELAEMLARLALERLRKRRIGGAAAGVDHFHAGGVALGG